MAKVLVTGANGFLGSWLVKKLAAQNEVSCLVRKTSDVSELQGLSCQYVYGDVTDLKSLITACKNIDVIFHLAGLISYKRSDRKKMELINVQGTANVISAAVHNQVKKLIHISSVVAVGAGLHEGDILNEQSEFNLHDMNLGYFETKLAAEKLVLEAVQNKKLEAVILNPSTIYGAGDVKKGTRNTQLKVAKGKFPFYTSGGISVASVHSVVDAIVTAWKNGRVGQRYILAGENITIKRLFEIIAHEAQVSAPKIKLPNLILRLIGKAGDLINKFGIPISLSSEYTAASILFHWFDSSKAQAELGYKKTSAQQAIQESISWAKQKHLLTSE